MIDNSLRWNLSQKYSVIKGVWVEYDISLSRSLLLHECTMCECNKKKHITYAPCVITNLSDKKNMKLQKLGSLIDKE